MAPSLLDRIYKKSPDFIPRKIADELVLVPIRRQLSEIHSIYSANRTALAVWEMIDGTRSISEIRAEMLSRYAIDENSLDQDITNLLQQLEEIKAIQLI